MIIPNKIKMQPEMEAAVNFSPIQKYEVSAANTGSIAKIKATLVGDIHACK